MGPEEGEAPTSDEDADDQGETLSSSIMPEMRLTMDSGYCLVYRECHEPKIKATMTDLSWTRLMSASA